MKAQADGSSRTASTASVHNQGCGSTVHPSRRRSVSAAGTRLRRRLSKSFHRESTDSGFLTRRWPGPGTSGRSQPASCQSPRIHRWRRSHVGAVGRRIFFVQRRVAQEPRPGVATLDEVVAQDPVLRKAVVQRLLERIDVVDPLADEGSLVEYVLVDVGHGTRIGVYSRIASVQARVPRAIRTRQADTHARLQDPVPFGHQLVPGAPALAAETRAVERVRHHADELPRGLARQLRVAVERDHELDARQRRGPPYDEREPIVPRRPAEAH